MEDIREGVLTGHRLSEKIWATKYQYRDDRGSGDRTVRDTWQRVARALASVEPEGRDSHAVAFFRELEGLRFLPGGRILAGAGTTRAVTLFNCFVAGTIEDSIPGIFASLKEAAQTMQAGGGVGLDFSTLRPRGTRAHRTGSTASGPVSFLEVWDVMCQVLLSQGNRRGAMMASLRCDHPDVLEFIDAKAAPDRLKNFNLSVQVTDELLDRIRKDDTWELVFPAAAMAGSEPGSETVLRPWPGYATPVICRVVQRVPARRLWDRLMRSTYDTGEPGVLFVDRVNRHNNLWYRERLTTTNPCGEVPLPPHGACDLGSVNLTRLVLQPFTANARVDFAALVQTVRVAVRMLDNVIDLSDFPITAQREEAHQARRVGLGITGLGDLLVLLGHSYADEAARRLARAILATVRDTAYETSVELAQEKGSFPALDRERLLESEFARSLPERIRDRIRTFGLRNSHLTAVAPAGSISLLAGNVSSGIEPVFAHRLVRKLTGPDGSFSEHELHSFSLTAWRELRGDAPLPDTFVEAGSIAPKDQLRMQAAVQSYVDQAISKTVNVRLGASFEDFKELYLTAYELGLLGCSAFRAGRPMGHVLEPAGRQLEERACCDPSADVE